MVLLEQDGQTRKAIPRKIKDKLIRDGATAQA